MFNSEEAKLEEDEELVNELEVEDGDHVIHQVVSMKKKPKPVPKRNTSFFMKKMMSFKSRAQIGADEDEEYSSSSSDGSSSNSDDDEQSLDGDKSGGQYIDPPMPNIGHPVKIEMLITRNHKAQSGLKTLMEMVAKDVAESVNEVAHIPVSKDFDRVQVSAEATERMAKVRSGRDIEKRVQQSVKDIQKSLNYRKSALIMMNFNYSSQQVRKIEPIYVNETRSIIQHHHT
jgi:hypothetical protein